MYMYMYIYKYTCIDEHGRIYIYTAHTCMEEFVLYFVFLLFLLWLLFIVLLPVAILFFFQGMGSRDLSPESTALAAKLWKSQSFRLHPLRCCQET